MTDKNTFSRELYALEMVTSITIEKLVQEGLDGEDCYSKTRTVRTPDGAYDLYVAGYAKPLLRVSGQKTYVYADTFRTLWALPSDVDEKWDSVAYDVDYHYRRRVLDGSMPAGYFWGLTTLAAAGEGLERLVRDGWPLTHYRTDGRGMWSVLHRDKPHKKLFTVIASDDNLVAYVYENVPREDWPYGCHAAFLNEGCAHMAPPRPAREHPIRRLERMFGQ